MKSKAEPRHGLSRRDFIKLSTAGAAAVLGSSVGEIRASWQPPRAETTPVALQLYSVRNDCGENLDHALAEVAGMGYRGVEFAGYYHYADNPAGLRRRLDELGLKVAGTHIGTTQLHADNLRKTIDFHRTLGCRYLIVPGDSDFTDPEKSKTLAEVFNAAAEALKPEGMACGFHNHKGEFARHEGKTYWELFAERTVPDVVLQLDVGWALAAGADPVQKIRKHAGRTRTAHFKPTVLEGESGKTAILGQDSVSWPEVIEACRASGGTEWFIIEQEYYPDGRSPMECSRLSLEGLNRILKEM